MKVLYEGKHIRMARKGHWEFVQRVGVTGLVTLVPVTPEEKIVLVEQYRPPVDRPVIELPAGLAGDAGDKHESMASAAGRELVEETGYRAGRLQWLTRATVSPGLGDEIVDVYLAADLEKTGPGGGDDAESIVVHEVPLCEIDRWLDTAPERGLLVDLKVQMGLYYLRRAGWSW
jgi:ADP-ribose pyrophosphatase